MKMLVDKSNVENLGEMNMKLGGVGQGVQIFMVASLISFLYMQSLPLYYIVGIAITTDFSILV